MNLEISDMSLDVGSPFFGRLNVVVHISVGKTFLRFLRSSFLDMAGLLTEIPKSIGIKCSHVGMDTGRNSFFESFLVETSTYIHPKC